MLNFKAVPAIMAGRLFQCLSAPRTDFHVHGVNMFNQFNTLNLFIYFVAVLSVLVLHISCGEKEKCTAFNCPQGCCEGELCMEASAENCGREGSECVDCTADPRSDSCLNGRCVCQGEGTRCHEGAACDADGCSDTACVPSCEGQCPGSPDGCGELCTINDCDGCCDNSTCIATPSDSFCGIEGSECVDCTSFGLVCGHEGTCREANINDARFVQYSYPQAMAPSSTEPVTLTFQNIGTTVWTKESEYFLGSQSPQDNYVWGMNRVFPGANESVSPGETIEFHFQITAPSSPGTYDFQWRMVKEHVEWFGEFSPHTSITVGSFQVCESIRVLAGTDIDASTGIQTCINGTPYRQILELPAGVYRIDSQIDIGVNPIILRTEDKAVHMPRCSFENHDCAELKASPEFYDESGILRIISSGSEVHHIVVNGNMENRRPPNPAGVQCQAHNNRYGYNIQMLCDNCMLTNSVTKNALCGTGVELNGVRTNVQVLNNTISHNGIHNMEGLWADGLTVHDAIDSIFSENHAVDNTDIDIIFGGCQNCLIQNNSIWHSESFENSAFAALMLHAWPTTSGNFHGTITSDNHIDCGPHRQCGIGLYIGSHAWYIADTFGGIVRDNTILNAQFGLLIDDAFDMAVYNNPVSNSDSTTITSCGPKSAYDYGIGLDSHSIDTSGDTLGAVYHPVDFDGCIPNWWQ